MKRSIFLGLCIIICLSIGCSKSSSGSNDPTNNPVVGTGIASQYRGNTYEKAAAGVTSTVVISDAGAVTYTVATTGIEPVVLNYQATWIYETSENNYDIHAPGTASGLITIEFKNAGASIDFTTSGLTTTLNKKN